jgi:hypothetical protein
MSATISPSSAGASSDNAVNPFASNPISDRLTCGVAAGATP